MTPEQQSEKAIRRLLVATLRQEALITARDSEIGAIEARYAGRLTKCAAAIAESEATLEAYYLANREVVEESGRKSLQLTHGLIGMRATGNPALAPANDRWTWAKIERRVRRLFKARFFHPPKPATLDKLKLKRELSEEQLGKCGLRLEAGETFYVELDRPAPKAV